ncbi:nitroreductase family protein [Chloroflexota bacterium]
MTTGQINYDQIIEAVRWAPSGANSQPWEFIVVKKQELKGSNIELIKEQNVLSQRVELTREPEMHYSLVVRPLGRLGDTGTTVYIILCGDTLLQEAYPLGIDFQGKQNIFNSSLANVFPYMHLVAATLSLGSQWVSQVSFYSAQWLIKDVLGIPREL